MKAEFLIIGAQKAGTTWLLYNLQNHPELCLPSKELHFFSSDENFTKGVEWYHDQLVSCKEGGRIIGEKTPEYLDVISDKNSKTSKLTHERIFQYNSDIKLILIMRNPVDRALSAIQHMYRSRRVSPSVSIDQLVLGDSVWRAESFGVFNGGKYYSNILKYLDVFPKEQLLCLFYEDDVKLNYTNGLKKVCNFLDINGDVEFPKMNERKNYHSNAKLTLLLNYYFPLLKPLNKKLNMILPPYSPNVSSEVKQYLQDMYRKEVEGLVSLGYTPPQSWHLIRK
ncbi:hypothetical protein GGR28_002862 [Lewinella aquimaris]|uniref:Sulfotransferase domain-containing protein n=1 Tax=Neolewinella aquimaris TaxID=1835722 RepID=A0A840E934_9BACT|nr:sulfotransferase [Neolewinella aquimaris]MBB4080232.1 hypothetical protein [Neolewinella aquimaris]